MVVPGPRDFTSPSSWSSPRATTSPFNPLHTSRKASRRNRRVRKHGHDHVHDHVAAHDWGTFVTLQHWRGRCYLDVFLKIHTHPHDIDPVDITFFSFVTSSYLYCFGYLSLLAFLVYQQSVVHRAKHVLCREQFCTRLYRANCVGVW